MSFKVKHMIFGKISIILCLSLVLNNTFVIKSYADDAALMNPLFIPIATVVTAVALGSGIIAKNSEDAINGANQLVQNVISNIKSSEIQKSEADPSYVSPFKVINGGQPEKPSNDNKNGKWVALGAGALASNEIWTNKEAVQSIMSEINKLNGYNQTNFLNGYVSIDDVVAQGSVQNIALQLAKISNSAVTQFDSFIHSDYLEKISSEYDYDDFFYNVSVNVTNVIRSEPLYPRLFIHGYLKSDNISKLLINSNMDNFGYNTYSNKYGSISYYYTKNYGTDQQPIFVNNDNVTVNTKGFSVITNSRTSDEDFSIRYSSSLYDTNRFTVTSENTNFTYAIYGAYCGYKWAINNPWQFTNNVYNVNQTFDVNFPDWLQQSINLLGQQIEGLRLGLTTIQPSWNPTQEQIQSGLSPTNVINQYINNYENPEYIPEDNPNTGDEDKPVVVPPAVEEPQPTKDYLGNFLLPESITTKFPFCIPFDIARCLRLFSTSQREAPKWECDLNYGSSTYHVVIDLSMFNDVASFVRPLEYILFLVGLALGTRSLIRG